MAVSNGVKQLVYNAFDIGWGNETIYGTDNEDFTPPTDRKYAYIFVRNTRSGQETLGGLGNRKFLRQASIVVEISVPLNIGTSEADRLSKIANDIFEAKRLGPETWVSNAVTREVGTVKGFYMVEVEAFLTYEETK